jgi:hypothetical protein
MENMKVHIKNMQKLEKNYDNQKFYERSRRHAKNMIMIDFFFKN